MKHIFVYFHVYSGSSPAWFVLLSQLLQQLASFRDTKELHWNQELAPPKSSQFNSAPTRQERQGQQKKQALPLCNSDGAIIPRQSILYGSSLLQLSQFQQESICRWFGQEGSGTSNFYSQLDSRIDSLIQSSSVRDLISSIPIAIELDLCQFFNHPKVNMTKNSR